MVSLSNHAQRFNGFAVVHSKANIVRHGLVEPIKWYIAKSKNGLGNAGITERKRFVKRINTEPSSFVKASESRQALGHFHNAMPVRIGLHYRHKAYLGADQTKKLLHIMKEGSAIYFDPGAVG